MKHFSFSCQGESHKLIAKPCQDNSLSYSENGLAIAIVCDGHGGERYFRSDIGSRICVDLTLQAVKQFVEEVNKDLFVGSPFTQKTAIYERDSFDKLNETDKALRHLFSHIIFIWSKKIEEYTNLNPPTELELAKVNSIYIEELKNRKSLEKIYGCTLMVYVQTPYYWFAFHLGDGKCISFHNDKMEIWKEPIPWDERCFLNKTTSICDSCALDEFRYCYQGNGEFPAAIFLGSDGMDDSFGPIENLVDFYMQVLKMLSEKDEVEANLIIKETLPLLSKKGSQDDMSVAYVYNGKELNELVHNVLNYQITNIYQKIDEKQNEIKNLCSKINLLSNSNEQRDVIERDYALRDKEKIEKSLLLIRKKLEARLDELEKRQKNNGILKERKNKSKYIDLKRKLKSSRKKKRKRRNKYR